VGGVDLLKSDLRGYPFECKPTPMSQGLGHHRHFCAEFPFILSTSGLQVWNHVGPTLGQDIYSSLKVFPGSVLQMLVPTKSICLQG
jgi:hypothetical protein